MTCSLNLSPKEQGKENLTESIRIKPSVYACTVYYLSIKLKKSAKGILLFKLIRIFFHYDIPSPSYCQKFTSFIYSWE